MGNKYDLNLNELSELLEVASKQVPDLITNILNTVYSENAGANMGKAVGNLYKELIASGMPQELAATMASDYMISLKDMMKVTNFSRE
jgi:hypothetical protein